MMIAVSFLATALAVVWLILLLKVRNEDWIIAATCRVIDNQNKIDELNRKDRDAANKLAEYNGVAAKMMRLFLASDSTKEITKLQRENEALQRGNIKTVSLFDMPGYVLQRITALGSGNVFRGILEKCVELYGKKYASYKAKQLLARLVSYPVIGVAASMAMGCIFFSADNTVPGLVLMLGGSLMVLVLVYAMYDELGDKVKKRREAIAGQFPNVVSKLALLVTSGMIMDRAWRETAESQDTELYMEMRRTSDELSNLVAPEIAYTNFLNRCNTKETTKLSSALIQSQSKGNAEVGALLKNMAHEAWQERRHTAKRASEAANSKLMIPTMLLFLAILVIIMVPVAMNFSSL